MFFRKIFTRHDKQWLDEQRTDYRQLDASAENPEATLKAEYERQITLVLRRWGIPETCASVEILRLGEGIDGRHVFAAIVRILAWERKPALRLLVGLPLLERKVRKIIRAHWLAEVSHFRGVWLHASERLADAGADAELRHLIAAVTHPPGSASRAVRGSGDNGPSSLK